jgi:hypothetical protein
MQPRTSGTVQTGAQSISDPGSETGAANCAKPRPSSASIPQPRLLTCADVSYQAACPEVCSVVVLGVVIPNPIAHPIAIYELSAQAPLRT